MPWSGSSKRSAICESMNCNDCQDRVFELIEREAVDPEGVREILASCPECRALFDALKEALAAAKRLPLEEPTPGIDAAIMRAAATGRAAAAPPAKRWLQAPAWAVAAVALLAVGIGVWVAPPSHRADRKEVPADLVDAELKPAPVSPGAPVADHSMAAEATADRISQSEDETGPSRARLEKEARARKAAPGSHTGQALSDARARKPTETPSAAEAEGLMATKAREPQPGALSAECQERIARAERTRDAADEEVNPEEALSIGRCYQAAGKKSDARAWLRRAAAHPQTRARARRALRRLEAE